MTHDANGAKEGILEPEAELPPEELRALVDQIARSGALGRSKVYRDLLRYLCECRIVGDIPKEIVIAIDVMGKDASFDVKNDSLVRVYMHKLRQKLDAYYHKQGKSDRYRVTVPKGQYTLAIVDRQEKSPETDTGDISAESDGSSENTAPAPGGDAHWWRERSVVWVLILCALLLAVDIAYRAFDGGGSPKAVSASPSLADTTLWAPILDNDAPVAVVLGDEYFFGEVDQAGEVRRLLRDPAVNTPRDMARLPGPPATGLSYQDLDLTYLPRATASVLRDIFPLLLAAGKQVTVRMSSELKGADLRGQHILYIGYIGGMGELRSFAFQASAFDVGDSFDQLVHRESGEIYNSEELEKAKHRNDFYDFGMISSFPMLDGHQMMYIAGTRGTGMMHMGHVVSDERYLRSINGALGPVGEAGEPLAFEAFYRVIGYDRLNFDAERIYLGRLDYRRIWGGEMMNLPH